MLGHDVLLIRYSSRACENVVFSKRSQSFPRKGGSLADHLPCLARIDVIATFQLVESWLGRGRRVPTIPSIQATSIFSDSFEASLIVRISMFDSRQEKIAFKQPLS